jgi:hypothetical protein
VNFEKPVFKKIAYDKPIVLQLFKILRSSTRASAILSLIDEVCLVGVNVLGE